MNTPLSSLSFRMGLARAHASLFGAWRAAPIVATAFATFALAAGVASAKPVAPPRDDIRIVEPPAQDLANDDGKPNSAASVSVEPFRCPGTNVAFFEEIKEAKWIGFEETWDFNTCGEGQTIYAEGAGKAWPAFRSQRPRPVLSVRPSGKPVNVEFYATVLPWVAFGTIGVVIGLAWLLSIITRRKRITLVDVPCPKCAVEIPVPLNDPDAKSLFCPACGGASVIVVTGDDGVAYPEVTVL